MAVGFTAGTAAKTLDWHWSRMTTALPPAGGLVGDQSGRFRDRFVHVAMGRSSVHITIGGWVIG